MLFDNKGKIIQDPDVIKSALSNEMGTFKILKLGYSFKDYDNDIERELENWFFLDDQSLNVTEWRSFDSNLDSLKVWVENSEKEGWTRQYVNWCVAGNIKRYKIEVASNSIDSKIRKQKNLFKEKWKGDCLQNKNSENIDTNDVKALNKNW